MNLATSALTAKRDLTILLWTIITQSFYQVINQPQRKES